MKRPAVFAVPGDIETRTGGYIFERQLLLALRRRGRDVRHLALPGSYPDPTPGDLDITGDAFAAIPRDVPVLLDGFLTGATDPAVFARLSAPFVAITHHPLGLETGLAPARARALREIERANLARAAHVIVPSPHTARTLTQDFAVPGPRITVVEPGVSRPAAAARVDRSGADGPLVLSVGQLVSRKGHDVLLRALAQLRHLPWRTVVIGGEADPAHAASLRALRAELGLDDRVRFAGSVGNAELADWYARADVFALATWYEGYGMVFAEALAAGLPIVACAGGAVAETVPPDTGYLVAPGDAEEFAGALARVLEDGRLRENLSAASRQAAARLPTWDDAARVVDAILDRIAD